MRSLNTKFVSLMVVLLLGACSPGEKQPTAERSPEITPPPSLNPIADAPPPLGKAKDTCGDALPKDEKAYPVSFYPVFVSYSEKNFEVVKKHFCGDAIKRRSEKLGKDVVQVGSFATRERASALKTELSVHLQGANIGEPTVIHGTKNVGEAAKLSPQQIKELRDIVGIGRDFETQDVVVLPTEVPKGFRVSGFNVTKQTHRSPQFQGGIYNIIYKNSEGVSFMISGGVSSPTGDAPTVYKQTKEIISPALGKFEMGVDRVNDTSTDRFIMLVPNMGIIRGRNRYTFTSFAKDGTPRISEKDAIQVLQSMQFLTP